MLVWIFGTPKLKKKHLQTLLHGLYCDLIKRHCLICAIFKNISVGLLFVRLLIVILPGREVYTFNCSKIYYEHGKFTHKQKTVWVCVNQEWKKHIFFWKIISAGWQMEGFILSQVLVSCLQWVGFLPWEAAWCFRKHERVGEKSLLGDK